LLKRSTPFSADLSRLIKNFQRTVIMPGRFGVFSLVCTIVMKPGSGMKCLRQRFNYTMPRNVNVPPRGIKAE
jgi:hypothetical protein